MTIIPAIDIIEGKAVRLEQGDFSKKIIYDEDPLEVAKKFEANGIIRLHLVDLDGARTGKVRNWKVLERIASRTGLVIDFGGGIKTDEELRIVFNSGASLATIGSLAVANETLFIQWLQHYGARKFLLGADVKKEKISIDGWQKVSDMWIYDLIAKYTVHDLKEIFCTDISKDGLLKGPSTDLYKKILEKFPQLKLIASGGITTMNDLEELATIGCSGAIIGKAIYENRISLMDLKKWTYEREN